MNNYYDEHSKEFIENTINCDMTNLYEFFLKYVDYKGTLLDLGFGSGRDSLYFKNKGFSVTSLDNSRELCENAKSLNLDCIICQDILDFNEKNKFDYIWACASLLHIKKKDLPKAFSNCYNSLKNNGIMYASFKYGDFEGLRGDRYYTDLTLDSFKDIIKNLNFAIIDTKITFDVRPDRADEKWLNVILKKLNN